MHCSVFGHYLIFFPNLYKMLRLFWLCCDLAAMCDFLKFIFFSSVAKINIFILQHGYHSGDL